MTCLRRAQYGKQLRGVKTTELPEHFQRIIFVNTFMKSMRWQRFWRHQRTSHEIPQQGNVKIWKEAFIDTVIDILHSHLYHSMKLTNIKYPISRYRNDTT